MDQVAHHGLGIMSGRGWYWIDRFRLLVSRKPCHRSKDIARIVVYGFGKSIP